MADQASVNGRLATHFQPSTSSELGGVAEFVDDLATLADLQGRLAAIDLRDAARKSAIPFAITMLGISVGVSGIAGVLFGTAWVIATTWKIHQGWAMIMTATAAMIVGGIAIAFGIMNLGRSFDSFQRSRKQLRVNLGWVRTVLARTSASRSRSRYRS